MLLTLYCRNNNSVPSCPLLTKNYAYSYQHLKMINALKCCSQIVYSSNCSIYFVTADDCDEIVDRNCGCCSRCCPTRFISFLKFQLVLYKASHSIPLCSISPPITDNINMYIFKCHSFLYFRLCPILCLNYSSRFAYFSMCWRWRLSIITCQRPWRKH